jgi:hypothetical protein
MRTTSFFATGTHLTANQNGILLLIAAVISAASLAVACTTSPTDNLTEPDIAAVRAYADPETETTLQGLSAGNMALYSKFFSEPMKAAVTPDLLEKTAAQLNSQLGTYISKEFRGIEQKSGYIIVHYRAKFSKGDTGIRMVFDKDRLVAGQWFE